MLLDEVVEVQQVIGDLVRRDDRELTVVEHEGYILSTWGGR